MLKQRRSFGYERLIASGFLTIFLISCSSSPDFLSLPAVNFLRNSEADVRRGPLGRGIGLGNFLDVYKEQNSSKGKVKTFNFRMNDVCQIEDSIDLLYDGCLDTQLKRISDAKFSSVRIPIVWFDEYGIKLPDYEIRRKILHYLIYLAIEKYDLKVIINVHHFKAFNADPGKHIVVLKNHWKRMAEDFRGKYYEHLFFEILNEPNADGDNCFTIKEDENKKHCNNLNNDKLIMIYPEIIASARLVYEPRWLILGGDDYNSDEGLKNLATDFLDGKQRIILTFHYYGPHHFTHQCSWEMNETYKSNGTDVACYQGKYRKIKKWPKADSNECKYPDYDCIQGTMAKIKDQFVDQGFPVLLGEFGMFRGHNYQYDNFQNRTAIDKAFKKGNTQQGQNNDYVDLALPWIYTVSKNAWDNEIDWVYWDYNSDFGLLDSDRSINSRMHKALFCDSNKNDPFCRRLEKIAKGQEKDYLKNFKENGCPVHLNKEIGPCPEP